MIGMGVSVPVVADLVSPEAISSTRSGKSAAYLPVTKKVTLTWCDSHTFRMEGM